MALTCCWSQKLDSVEYFRMALTCCWSQKCIWWRAFAKCAHGKDRVARSLRQEQDECSDVGQPS
eukprot:3483833-Amphidinium_carterae.1